MAVMKVNSDEIASIVNDVFCERILPEVIEAHCRFKSMDADVWIMMNIVYAAAKLRTIVPSLKYIKDGWNDSKEKGNKGQEIELLKIDDGVNEWVSEYLSSYKTENADAKLIV